MSTTKTYTDRTAVLCYGPDAFHTVIAEPNTVVSTGQPTVEEFDSEAEAVQRILALRPAALATAPEEFINALVPADGIPEWSPDGTYPIHTLVQHDDRTWLHISDRQGEPDDVYDIAAGTGDWVPVPYASAS